MSSLLTDEPEHEPLTFEQAMAVTATAYGEAGRRIMLLWAQYNEAYFGGVLKPVPIIFVPASPYGHWVGLFSASRQGASNHIYILRSPSWAVQRGILLHEQI